MDEWQIETDVRKDQKASNEAQFSAPQSWSPGYCPVLLDSALLGVRREQKGLQEMVENRKWRGKRKPKENAITEFLSYVSVLSNTQSITCLPIKLGSFAAEYFLWELMKSVRCVKRCGCPTTSVTRHLSKV